jgi:hypothetical protein
MLTYALIRVGGEEFLAAVRPLTEHLHVQDKHPALLLASFVLFTPGWADRAGRSVEGSIFAALEDARYAPLAHLPAASSSSSAHAAAAKGILRLLFPFLEIPARYCLSRDKASASGGGDGGRGGGGGRGEAAAVRNTGVSSLLQRLVALPNAADLLRALLVGGFGWVGGCAIIYIYIYIYMCICIYIYMHMHMHKI